MLLAARQEALLQDKSAAENKLINLNYKPDIAMKVSQYQIGHVNNLNYTTEVNYTKEGRRV